MKIYLKEEILKMTFICLDATCSPTNHPTIQPSNHPTTAWSFQESLKDFFYSSQETDCIQTVPTSSPAVRN